MGICGLRSLRLINVILSTILVLVGCDAQGPCLTTLPEDLARRQSELAKRNEEEKLKVLNAQRSALRVTPLEASLILTDTEDPYPHSTPIHLSPPTSPGIVLLGKYVVFHGGPGSQTVYETLASSKRYFIVEEILVGTNNQSLHSWHVTPNNELIRAVIAPRTHTIDTIRVCGCSPDSTEFGILDDLLDGSPIVAEPSVSYGIFMLPGDKRPSLLNDTFEVEYDVQTIDIQYVPKNGKVCRPNQVVC